MRRSESGPANVAGHFVLLNDHELKSLDVATLGTATAACLEDMFMNCSFSFAGPEMSSLCKALL